MRFDRIPDMIQPYGYKGALKRLAESLNATGVLSDSYGSEVFNLALTAYGEGHDAATRELGASKPAYEAALRMVADFTEELAGTVGYTRSGSPCDDVSSADYFIMPEYTRGQLELLCDMFPGANYIDTETRMYTIINDIYALVAA